MLIEKDSCPFCDSFNYSQIDKDLIHCRDCGEKWKNEPENFDLWTSDTGDEM